MAATTHGLFRRSGVSPGMRTCSCALLALTLAVPLGAQRATVHVTGTVLSSLSGEPLPGVLLTVSREAARTTDSSGRFDFPALPGGQVSMHIEYEGKVSPDQALDLSSEKELRIEVLLDSAAADLAPHVVNADRLDNQLGLAGFYARRHLGFGRFFSRADVAKAHYHRMSQVLSSVGAMYRCGGRNCGPVLLGGGRECTMSVLIDGYPANRQDLSAMELDEVVGVEVYRRGYDIGSGVTLENGYELSALARRCGLVVIWTRDAGARSS